MYLHSAVLTTLSLLTLTSAHFNILYPPGRGESGTSGPCGGYGVSSERTPWPLTGGEVKFETEHDQSKTEVWLYVGNNPQGTNDFTVNLKPVFLQIGLGAFCWDTLGVPNGTAGVKDGADATIQLKLSGDDGTLYACSDVVFAADAPKPSGTCANDSGISTEPIQTASPTGTGNGQGNGQGGGNGGGASGLSVTFGSIGAVFLAAAVGALL